MKTIVFSFLVVLFSFAFSFPAESAHLTGFVGFFDGRTDVDPASKLISNGVTHRVKEGKFRVYDEDGLCNDFTTGCTETDDDYLGTFYTDDNGQFDVTVGNGQDLYFWFNFENVYGQVRYVMDTRRTIVSTTIPNASGEVIINWDVVCNDYPGSFCGNQSAVNANSDYFLNQEFMHILASIYDTAVVFDDSNVMNYGNYNYPDGEEFIGYLYGSPSDTNCSGLAGRSLDTRRFCVGNGSAAANQVIAHEMGHCLHKRALRHSGEVSGCAGIWNPTSTQIVGEKCAVAEGWAFFVAGVVYWDRNEPSAYYRNPGRNFEGFTNSGNGALSACVNNASSPGSSAGNAARWFWDMYDTTLVNEAFSQDNASMSFEFITSFWLDFPSGYSNRQTLESGLNGRNAYDYVYYNSNGGTERDLNCLGGQQQ